MTGILFLDNAKLENIDDVKKGNPGIGGSEYLVLQLFYYLNNKRDDIYLFTTDYGLMGKNVVHIKDINRLLLELDKYNIKKLIFIPKNIDVSYYIAFDERNIKCIAWVHNYLSFDLIDVLSTHECIKRVVFVGNQHYDCYIDDKIIQKSTYIYNMISPKNIKYVSPDTKDNIVTYVGALIPAKGFHKLAKVWKKVLKKVPDAKLFVIGSGKLYNENNKLGKYGIASEMYEKRFIKFLLNKEGKIIDSVKFLGVLGNEKDNILYATKVGVANPTGISETFCLSAVEYKQFGIPVVSYKGYGLLDTIRNNYDGILIKSNRKLTKTIVNLLINNEKNRELGYNGYIDGYQKFLPDNIIKNWEILIDQIDDDNEIMIPRNYFIDDYKFIKILHYKFKMRFHINTKSLAYRISFLKNCVKKIIGR